MTIGIDKLVSILISVIILIVILFFFKDGWAPDLSAVYFAARSYGLGLTELIYLSPPTFFGGSASPEWIQMVTDLGFEGKPALPYVYPPIWAALLSNVAVTVGPIAFFNMVLFIHALAVIASIELSFRIFNTPQVSRSVWFAVSLLIVFLTTPFFTAFWLNQPHIFVTFLVLFGFERYQKGHVLLAGMIIGLAGALKLSPIIFGVIFLYDRNWKAAAAMAFTGFVILAASILTTGIQLHFDFLDQLGRVKDNVLITPLNFGLEGLIYRMQDIFASRNMDLNSAIASYYIPASPYVGAIGLSCLLLGLMVIWLKNRQRSETNSILWKLLAVWSISVFCGPLAWSHYLIGPLLLLPGLVLGWRSSWSILGMGTVLMLLSHPTQRVLMNTGSDPIWLMSFGGLSVLLMFIGAVLRSAK